ncbi:hypothetical protein DFP72DRAFT_843268 [Ephemerocybe angulata]|uniref:Uncharacterized protein n=1 Tax=Ephemerocybe angulata TaxID=980116 RepID=A0A8H6IB21_9AGAR|nr:hypothetical protein DFP72DRAFT_843268 [Tulosesus angulatus]
MSSDIAPAHVEEQKTQPDERGTQQSIDPGRLVEQTNRPIAQTDGRLNDWKNEHLRKNEHLSKPAPQQPRAGQGRSGELDEVAEGSPSDSQAAVGRDEGRIRDSKTLKRAKNEATADHNEMSSATSNTLAPHVVGVRVVRKGGRRWRKRWVVTWEGERARTKRVSREERRGEEGKAEEPDYRGWRRMPNRQKHVPYLPSFVYGRLYNTEEDRGRSKHEYGEAMSRPRNERDVLSPKTIVVTAKGRTKGDESPATGVGVRGGGEMASASASAPEPNTDRRGKLGEVSVGGGRERKVRREVETARLSARGRELGGTDAVSDWDGSNVFERAAAAYTMPGTLRRSRLGTRSVWGEMSSGGARRMEGVDEGFHDLVLRPVFGEVPMEQTSSAMSREQEEGTASPQTGWTMQGDKKGGIRKMGSDDMKECGRMTMVMFGSACHRSRRQAACISILFIPSNHHHHYA